jgi:hypothetical protein
MNYTFNYIIGGTLLRRQVVHFYSGLDNRIFDRADISIFKGKSYRLKGKIIMKNIDLNSKKK